MKFLVFMLYKKKLVMKNVKIQVSDNKFIKTNKKNLGVGHYSLLRNIIYNILY